MLKLNNVSKKYGDKIVLDDISYEFNNCGIYFIIGSSGSGKSTFLNILGGLEKPTSGTLECDKIVSFVFQEYNLLVDLSVVDNIKLIGNISDSEIDEILSSLNLLSIKDTSVKHLSGGEKQRLAIARALATNSSIILLDEPTGNLDPDNALIIMEKIKEISENKIIIVVSHNREFANQYADVLLEIKDKKIVEKKNEVKLNLIKDNGILHNIFPFKFQLKYAMNFIKHKKIKFIFSILLSFISLLLLFVVFNISFYSIRNALIDGIDSSDNTLLSVEKDYYNEYTDEYRTVKKGNTLRNDITGLVENSLYAYVGIESECLNKNNKKMPINLIVDNKSYNERFIITDFLAYYLFNASDVVNQTLNFEVDGIQLQLKITEVLDTNYTKEMYENYMLDTKYYEKNIDALLFNYNVCYINQDYLISKLKENNEIYLPASNFTISDLTTSRYCDSYNTIKYIKDTSNTLENNNVLISKEFSDLFTGGNFPKKYTYMDIRESINANLYLEYFNLYDVYSEVNVLSIYEGSEKEVMVSSEFFDKIIDNYFYYFIDGYCLDSSNNVKNIVTAYLDNHINFSNSNLEPCYNVDQVINFTVKDIMLGVSIILLVLSIVAIHQSVIGFIELKNKEIGILKCLNIKKRRIFNVFIIYGAIIVGISYLLSLFFGNIILASLNSFFKSEDGFSIHYNLFNFNIESYLCLFVVAIISLVLTLIIPMNKVSKIDSSLLVKEGA